MCGSLWSDGYFKTINYYFVPSLFRTLGIHELFPLRADQYNIRTISVLDEFAEVGESISNLISKYGQILEWLPIVKKRSMSKCHL